MSRTAKMPITLIVSAKTGEPLYATTNIPKGWKFDKIEEDEYVATGVKRTGYDDEYDFFVIFDKEKKSYSYTLQRVSLTDKKWVAGDAHAPTSKTITILKINPTPTKKREEEEDFIYSPCKTCGFRVGAHSIKESKECGLM